MPRRRTYLFTKPTEMHGILGRASWAQSSMRAAINMGTGPWFCLFVDGEWRAAVEMGDFLVRIGFEFAYDFTKQERDARRLARTALMVRQGKLDAGELVSLHIELDQKYSRQFESVPLLVANRLATDNSLMVASAACIEGVNADFEVIEGSIIDYARRVIRR